MRAITLRAAVLTFALVLVGGAGTAAEGQHPRRTPVVEAVQKTHGAVLTLKVERQGVATPRHSLGTAVVVDERGYAVTNRHVVCDAARVTAYLPDGTGYPAAVVVTEAKYDLAILKIDAPRPLRALPLGPSSDLLVGEEVLAVGAPYGFQNTVSRGIISALDRDITLPTGEKLTGLIQTDAAINPGNSGGPLININGELIGINVAVRDGAQGIAFAIPSDRVKEFLSFHLSAKKMTGLDHGLACTERVEPEGLDRQHVLVAGTRADTLAARAGVRPGDQIIQVGSRRVANRFDVERALWGHKPGDEVHFIVHRDGETLQLSTAVPGGPQELAAGRK
jgi:serine protease Do